VTEKTIEANKATTSKPTGPKTGAHKGHAAVNSTELDWFTSELQISEADRPKFEALRDRLAQKYVAPTYLRQIVRDLIVSCTWLYKLELRKKTRSVGLQETPHEQTMEAAGGDTVPIEKWYGVDYRSLQGALRFLRELGADVAQHGLLHLEEDGPLKQSVIKGFGQNFYDRLTKWKFMSPSAIGLAQHMEIMLTTFKMKPPVGLLRGNPEHQAAMSDTTGLKPPVVDGSPGGPDHSPASRVIFNLKPPPMDPGSGGLEDFKLPQVAPDPGLPKQMYLKLIDVEIEHLEALIRIRRQDTGKAPHALSEFSERSLADANRDLQRAIELFLKLEGKGL
jgi:hypothetical protein